MKVYRLLELDALRGIAALAVVLFHYTTKFEELFKSNLTTKYFEFEYGHYGVQLFFIISGFVIFMTINKVHTGLEFVFKRFLRLYPIFIACLLLTYAITTIFPPGFGRTPTDFLVSFTMMPALLGFKPIDGAYWSLEPELLFYTMMLGLFLIKQLDKIVLFGFIWLTGSFLFTLGYIPSVFVVLLNLQFAVLFLAGINFYILFNKDDQKSFLNHLQIFVCILISFFLKDKLFPYFFISFIIVFYLFIYHKLAFLKIAPLVYLGKISYALYLIHQFIGYTIQYALIHNFEVENSVILITLPLLCSIGLAVLLTEFVEKPILLKGNEWYKTVKTKLLVKS